MAMVDLPIKNGDLPIKNGGFPIVFLECFPEGANRISLGCAGQVCACAGGGGTPRVRVRTRRTGSRKVRWPKPWEIMGKSAKNPIEELDIWGWGWVKIYRILHGSPIVLGGWKFRKSQPWGFIMAMAGKRPKASVIWPVMAHQCTTGRIKFETIWTNHCWLVVSNMNFIFHFIYGMSSFPIDFHIFQRGGSTTNQIIINHH